MISILNNIFKEKGYEVLKEISLEKQKYTMYKNHNSIEEFFVLSNFKLNDISEFNESLILKELELLFYEIIESKFYKPVMDKNTSLIICLELDNLKDEKDIEHVIYTLEEDPYYFKKYTITYTKEQIEKYNTNITKNMDDTNLMQLIQNEMMDHNKFNEFKYHMNLPTLYNLIAKLYIKIPFLNYKFEHKNINDLEENILKSMNSDLRELDDKFLDLCSDSKNIEFDIDNLLDIVSNFKIFNISDAEEHKLWKEIENELNKIKE